MLIELTKDHLHELYEIEQVCFSHPWSKESLLSELTSPHTICLGVRNEGELAGFCFLSALLGEGTVLQVAVLPQHRNKGYGKQLTAAALQQAKNMGTEVVFLEVRESNTPAKGLYRSLGFEEIDLRKEYYRDGENAMIMQWREQNENSGD